MYIYLEPESTPFFSVFEPFPLQIAKKGPNLFRPAAGSISQIFQFFSVPFYYLHKILKCLQFLFIVGGGGYVPEPCFPGLAGRLGQNAVLVIKANKQRLAGVARALLLPCFHTLSLYTERRSVHSVKEGVQTI